VYGLVGENGNGKTTLLRILARDLRMTGGKVRYNGESQSENLYDLRTNLVYVPQRTPKWYGSLLDNLKFVLSNYNFPPHEIELRVLLMIARLGIWQYKHLKWSELSSGYKMRFELARTLLQEPEVMLLDEPLANLDVMAQQVVLDDLKSIGSSLSRPMALLLTSQQLYQVEKVSDEVIFLKNGELTSNNSSFTDDQGKQLILELECSHSKRELIQVFEAIGIEEIKYNGGVYILIFPRPTTLHMVFKAISSAELDITYIRNISQSTRRFFLQ
jgi:ABC-2 type transport system ATP-binding protein